MKKTCHMYLLLLVGCTIVLLSANTYANQKVVVIPLNKDAESESDDSWSRLIDDSSRFELVMNDEAVLDRETGLVWDRNPGTSTSVWQAAPEYCYKRAVGQRYGWRLPTVAELASLVDNSNSSPALPTNHSFQNIQTSNGLDRYWTITSVAFNPDYAFYVSFYGTGNINYEEKVLSGDPKYYRWCVRGGNSNGPH